MRVCGGDARGAEQGGLTVVAAVDELMRRRTPAATAMAMGPRITSPDGWSCRLPCHLASVGANQSMHRSSLFLALLAALLRPCAAQARCKLPDVRRDGIWTTGHCDELLLMGEKIGDDGAVALAQALAFDRRLKLVDLWANGVGPKGAAALAKALETNTALQKLYLNENTIGSEGTASLARALTINRSLLTLWLSRNGIGDAGADALAGVLKNTQARRLEALDLWGNGISAAGGTAIAEALHSNHMLRTLEMRDNAMGDGVARAFAAMMPRNRALATLDLVNSGFTQAGVDALRGGLKVSTANPYLVLFADGAHGTCSPPERSRDSALQGSRAPAPLPLLLTRARVRVSCGRISTPAGHELGAAREAQCAVTGDADGEPQDAESPKTRDRPDPSHQVR